MTSDRRLSFLIRRLRWRNDRGVAAIEFALVIPVLLTLYVGSVDLCLGVTTSRKVQHATSLMNDLVTRVSNITKKDLEGVFDMGDVSVMPRAVRLASSKITSIYVDKAGKATVKWSRARRTTPDNVNSVVSLPSKLTALRDAYVVRSTTTYSFEPLGGFGLTGPFAMGEEIYGHARVGSGVNCSDC